MRARSLATNPDLDRAAKLTALNELYLRVMIETAPLSMVAFGEDVERGQALYQTSISALMEETASALYEVAIGEPLPPAAAGVAKMCMFGVHFGVAVDSMVRGEPVDVEQMAERITEIFR